MKTSLITRCTSSNKSFISVSAVKIFGQLSILFEVVQHICILSAFWNYCRSLVALLQRLCFLSIFGNILFFLSFTEKGAANTTGSAHEMQLCIVYYLQWNCHHMLASNHKNKTLSSVSTEAYHLGDMLLVSSDGTLKLMNVLFCRNVSVSPQYCTP